MIMTVTDNRHVTIHIYWITMDWHGNLESTCCHDMFITSNQGSIVVAGVGKRWVGERTIRFREVILMDD